MEIVRLGQGVDATGRLAPEALARTLAVLRSVRRRSSAAAGATAVRMVATSATRDAANAAEFVAGVRGILGVGPEVLSGDEEAPLSFTGATAELGGRGADGGARPVTAGGPAVPGRRHRRRLDRVRARRTRRVVTRRPSRWTSAASG